MSVVYSLYDALVSIKVPDDKAKAVIDAMEREMMDKLATKADLSTLEAGVSGELKLIRQEISSTRELLSKDINAAFLDVTHTRERLTSEIGRAQADIKTLSDRVTGEFDSLDKKFATKTDLAEFGQRLTGKIYRAAAGAVALNCTILGTLVIFLR